MGIIKMLRELSTLLKGDDSVYTDEEQVEIQLIEVKVTAKKQSHRWILITSILVNGKIVEVGTRHHNYHLMDALKGHWKMIHIKYGVDMLYKIDLFYYNRVIIPLLMKSSDFRLKMKTSNKRTRKYLASMVVPPTFAYL